MSHDEAEFRELAKHAITLGLLTDAERDLICRRHSRKQIYWTRHLRDLIVTLSDRLNRLPIDNFDDNQHLLNLANVIEEKRHNIM